MSRIPEEVLERLKREVSVERLITGYGLVLTRHGAQDVVTRCPFHADGTPSLVVTPATNLWHCLGACQRGGGPIDWVMAAEGLSFRAAVAFLQGSREPTLNLSERGPRKSARMQTGEPLLASSAGSSGSAPSQSVWDAVVEHYHRTLMQSEEARGYLAGRGLDDEEALVHFRIGFSNRTLGYRLPSAASQEGARLREQLRGLGVYRASGHEHLRGCVTVPLGAAHPGEMYGRRVGNVEGGEVPHVYTPGERTSVWNASGLEHEVILCESVLDALTFWVSGYRSVTCAYGVNGFSAHHMTAFRARGVRTVRIAYDRDEAGDAASEKLSGVLHAEGIETYRVQFPRGMDANGYAQKVKPAKEALGLVVRKAAWVGKGAAPVAERVAVPRAAPLAASGSVAASAAADSAGLAAPEAATGLLAATEGESEGRLKKEAGEERASCTQSVEQASLERDELTYRFGARTWRVRGLSKNTSFNALRVNLSVRKESAASSLSANVHGGGFFVDTLDLYAARPRGVFVSQASAELEEEANVIKRDLGEVLLRLEAAQEARMSALLAPKALHPQMTESARDAALSLLRSPELLERIVEDLGACGLVGEDSNKLIAYLAATSRLLERPLAVIIQSTSAAGKSSLMEGVLALIPEEERISFSAMTGQSLFYMGQDALRHKVLAISEEEGAERASYALKLLQSEGSLTIASTGKDPVSGKHVTHTYRVEGPVQLFQTTTAVEMDEELLNRCLVLTVDEGREQTRAILAQQREAETLEGLLVKEQRKALRALHQNAQRLLRPLHVVNPFARELSFSDARTRMRRDHGKFLALIRTVALVHQHQRTVHRVVDPREGATHTATAAAKVLEYVEVTRGDIAIAERLFSSALARSLDELPPQTRGVLEALEARVMESARTQQVRREEVRFTQREARGWTGLSATQVRHHLQRLELLELVFVVRGKKAWEYVLAESPRDPDVDERTDRTGVARGAGPSDVLESFSVDEGVTRAVLENTLPAPMNGGSYVLPGAASLAAAGE
jgi:hypothetical protein